MTALVIAAVAAILLQVALQSPSLWWFMAAARPYLVVMVAAAPRFGPFGVAWFGLVLGLAADAVADGVIGPGGVAGAAAGLVVAAVVRRFELQGPLFWIGGTALAAIVNDLVGRAIAASLGMVPNAGWLGSLATLVATAVLALAVATAGAVWRTVTSPERRRRRVLKRL